MIAIDIDNNTMNTSSNTFDYFKFRGIFNNILVKVNHTFVNITRAHKKHIAVNRGYSSKELSQMMSNMFINTKVHVYIYDDIYANAFTIPGYTENIFKEQVHIINIIMSSIPLLGSFYTLLMEIYFAFRRAATLLKEGHIVNPQITFNKKTNKYDLGIDEITCYVSTGLLNILTEDEIRAVLLHEVGHNTMIIASVINNILNSITMRYLISYFILGTTVIAFDSDKKDYADNMMKLVSALFLLGIFGYFLCGYLSRRQEIKCDEFAIKAGYGKDLYTSLNKLRQHESFLNTIYSEILKKHLTFFDRVIMFVYNCITLIPKTLNNLGFGDYPTAKNRDDMITRKTLQRDAQKDKAFEDIKLS